MAPLSRSEEVRSAPPRKNALYATFEDAFRNVFFGPSPTRASFDGDLYVADRITVRPLDQIKGLLSRLPNDVRDLYNQDIIGVAELDFFDFVFNYDSNRVLLVLGAPGVGKSTFLTNISFNLQNQLESLQAFRTIQLDFLKSDDSKASTTHSALLAKLVGAAFEAFEGDLEPTAGEALTAFYQSVTNRLAPINITDLHDYISLIQKVTGKSLIIIFDNVDQIEEPEIIAHLTSVARSIFLETQQHVVVAQRPPSDRLRVEWSRGKDTYFPWVLDLPPPVLFPLVIKRFQRALEQASHKAPNRIISDTYEFPISLSNTKDRIKTYLRNVLTPKINEALLSKLSNNNVRSALVLVDNFLKFHKLSFNLLFDFRNQESFPYQDGTLVQRPFNHFLDGAMTGDRMFFTEQRQLPISNLFYFEYSGPSKYPHVTMYYILVLCAEFSGHLNSQTICNYFSHLDIPTQYVLRTLAHLVSRGLLTSNDSDGNKKTPNHVKISSAGRYQVGGFLQEQSYLLNVIYDVDIRLDTHSLTELDQYHSKVRALGTLLSVVAAEERSAFEGWKASDKIDSARALQIICSKGALSTRLWQAIRRLLRPRNVLRFSDVRHFNSTLLRIRDEITLETRRDLEWIKTFELEQARAAASTIRDQPQTQQYELSSIGSVELTHPRTLRAASPNTVSISFLPAFQITANEIVALWHATADKFYYRDYVPLSRTKPGAPFKGSFEIEKVEQDMCFPTRSDVRFFLDARELASIRLVPEAA